MSECPSISQTQTRTRTYTIVLTVYCKVVRTAAVRSITHTILHCQAKARKQKNIKLNE